jgi:glycosyltransferase involved in cell wall biosynthesis
MRGAVAAHLCRGRDWRGGERQVRLLVNTLARRSGFLQYLFTGRNTALARALEEGGASLVEVPWRGAWDPRAFGRTLTRLARIRGRHGADVVLHAHDSHALGIGIATSRLLGLPLIATRRSDSPPGRLWRIPERVIAISDSVADALREGGVAEARITRIPSAVSLDALGETSGDRSPLHADGGAPVVITVGALTPEKGHATLLHAIAVLRSRIPVVRLVVVGDGPQRVPLTDLARTLGIADHVRFDGERHEAWALIRSARVLAQPSRREALGTAVLEAMALGTPIVASATGGLVELLGGGAGLLVPPGDAPALADALERALTDPLLRAALIHEARARAAGYDAPTVADRVAEVYRSALRMT